MAGTIYTPITLWEGFKFDLPIEEKSVETEKDGFIYKKIHLSGRKTKKGVVDIYALAVYDKKKTKMPGILILPNYTKTVDEKILLEFAKKGYYALMVDYAGNGEDDEKTVYPDDVSYARYSQNTDIHKIETDAKQTCWYEWVCVSRYAYYYLSTNEAVSSVGGFGIKHGATVLWQLATLEKLACAVFCFSAGWHAYRGHFKYSDNPEPELTDETYRYLAGIEPQSYAQHVQCPSFLITATNNCHFEVDRVFDTMQRVDSSLPRYVNYTVQTESLLDANSYKSVFKFLEKELKGAKVELPEEMEISCEMENGEIFIKVKPDFNHLSSLVIYSAEETANPAVRCWNLCAEKIETTDSYVLFKYQPYKYSGQAFFFASAKYNSGFNICSKIICKKFTPNQCFNENKSNVIYSSRENKNLFSPNLLEANTETVAYMSQEDFKLVETKKGAFDIEGVTAKNGIRSLKINNKKDKPKENSILLTDVYAPDGGVLKVILTLNNGDKYSLSQKVSGGEVWHKCSFSLVKFKTEDGMALKSVDDVCSITFEFDGQYLLNNILWV